MNIVITDWALQSYLDLKHKYVFTPADYHSKFRPGALLLADFPSPAEFTNSNFWGPTQIGRGNNLKGGYKMKWDSVGPGRVELRLGVTFFQGEAFLCQAYVKSKPQDDYRQGLNLARYIEQIQKNRVVKRGLLT